jgi:hypothetical protein
MITGGKIVLCFPTLVDGAGESWIFPTVMQLDYSKYPACFHVSFVTTPVPASKIYELRDTVWVENILNL